MIVQWPPFGLESNQGRKVQAVLARASRKASLVLTSGAMRTPPIASPLAT
jgi:hypothetical protein